MLGAVDRLSRPRWAVIQDARHRQRRRQGWILAAVFAVLVAAVVGWLIASSDNPGRTAAPPAIAVPRVQQPRLAGRVEDTTTLHGKVWALTCVHRCAGTGHGSVGQLTELDDRDLRVLTRAPVADPGVLTASNGAIWIAHFATGNLSRVDTKTGHTVASLHLQLPRPNVWGDRAFLPSGITFADGRIWVTTARGYVAEIDPRHLHVVRTIRSTSQATSTTTAAGRVWIADDGYGIGTVNPNSTRVIRHRIPWHGQPVSIETVASGAGLIWSLGSKTDGQDLTTGTVVTTIDPTTGRSTHQWSTPSGASMIVTNNGAYVAGLRGGQILHLTASQRPQRIDGPSFSNLTTATPHALWATTKRGNLLRIALTR
jgi:streptogramin lyase